MQRIIVALDKPTYGEAFLLAQRLDPGLCRVKVGKELFTVAGPAIVDALMKLGFEVFLDLKYHDIPNTVAGAVRAACGLGVWMVNVHCLGGRKMMEAAAEAAKNVPKPPLLIGVTVLTSMDTTDLEEVGIPKEPIERPMDYFVNKEAYPDEFVATTKTEVMRLAKLAQASGLDGVVCSGQEVEPLRKGYRWEPAVDKDFILVTPGIRLPDAAADDQARIMTPEKAILTGADYLVVGRPITGALDPIGALQEFNQRVSSALCG